MNQYDVVIVNYNGEKILKRCLESIINSSLKPEKIIIVDNDSKDGSIKLINELRIKNICLIKNDRNIGFGPANNQALELVESNYVLIMNNDVVLDRKCAENLLSGFSDDNIVIINPLIISGWDRNDESSIYSFGAVMNDAGFGYSLTDRGKNIFSLSCFSGACFMARSKAIKEVGFEPSFFLYYEEPDVSAKVLGKGYQIGRVKEAKCYHLESYSSPQKTIDGIAFRQFYGIQNRWYLIGKYWPPELLLRALFYNLIHLIYFLLFFLKHLKFEYLSLLFIAPKRFHQGRTNRIINKNMLWYKILARDGIVKYLTVKNSVVKRSSN